LGLVADVVIQLIGIWHALPPELMAALAQTMRGCNAHR
jgi:hypothetical protein